MRISAALSIAVLATSISQCEAADISMCDIANKPASFDHRVISLQGPARSVWETTSRAGNDYTTFKMGDAEGCVVDVFTWRHPGISDRMKVKVEGMFEVEHHQGRYTFYKEVQATSVKVLH